MLFSSSKKFCEESFFLIWFNCNKIGCKQNMPYFNTERAMICVMWYKCNRFFKMPCSAVIFKLKELCIEHRFSCTNLYSQCKNMSKNSVHGINADQYTSKLWTVDQHSLTKTNKIWISLTYWLTKKAARGMLICH